MRDAAILLIRLTATAAILLKPDSVRTVVVQLVLVEHLFRMLNRSSEREEPAEVQSLINKLTNREREVLDLVVTGKSSKVVAYEIGFSQQTMEIHRARVME